MSCVFAQRLQVQNITSDPVSLARFPEESLFLGSGRALMQNGLDFFQRCEQIAGIVQARFLWKPFYIITDPAAIADVLVNHPKSFIKPYVLRRLKALFGNGLLTSDDDVWSHHRHVVQPAFGSCRMPRFLDLVRENTEGMVSSWRHGEVRDVYPDLLDLNMKNITQTMFGVYDEKLEHRASSGSDVP